MNSLKNKIFHYNILEHPIALISLVCIFSAFIFSVEAFSPASFMSLAIISLIIATLSFLAAPKGESLANTAIMACGYIVILFIFYLIFALQNKNKGVTVFLLAVFLAIIYVLYCLKNKMLTVNKMIPVILILGFAIRLSYILYTTVYQRQHDVQSFQTTDNGHAAYILYLYNNKSLPNFDVRTHWQFYHPPLHHIICALWIWIQTHFGIDIQTSYEGLQFLTLFYSTLSMYLSYRIMREMKVRRLGLAIAISIIAFHPIFIILSGGINNDILSITFMLGAILNTIVWYKHRTFRNIIKIALCIGFGMFTKLSVWMIAPAVAVVFLIVLIENRKKVGRIIAQYAAFLGVCVPIGLFWSVRNYILYKVPFTYVPKLSNTNIQYLGNHSIAERLFDFNWNQFDSVYNQMTLYSGKYFEYNPTIGLLKTAMFDEHINDTYYPSITFCGPLLFWTGVILAVFGFVAMTYILYKKKSMNRAFKVLFGLTYAIMIICYYMFCFQYPFCCTQNIRYTVPIIVIGALFIGILITRMQNKQTLFYRIFRKTATAVVFCFCFMSAMTYTLIGI